MNLFLPAILFVFLSGCCAFTSRDCNCKPPDPALTGETTIWLAPFNEKPFWVFQDDTGRIDTLFVNRTSLTEYCGGDECGSDCKVELASLISAKQAGLHCRISFKQNDLLQLNSPEESADMLYGGLYTSNEYTFSDNKNATSALLPQYEWNNQQTKVLEIKCNGGALCDGFPMKALLISRDFGLILFRSKDDREWRRVN